MIFSRDFTETCIEDGSLKNTSWALCLAGRPRKDHTPYYGGDLMSSLDWYIQGKRICKLIEFWEWLYSQELDPAYMKYVNCLRADLQEILKFYKETRRKELEATA